MQTKTNKDEIKDFLDMPLNTMGDLAEGIKIIRVPGGWVYRFQEGISLAVCFVPEPIMKEEE